jgi:hypothetical protein
MALTAVVLPASPVNAAPAAAAAARFCNHPTLGGTYFCDYGMAVAYLADGRKQVFVVGTNRSVYSRWQFTDDSWSDTWYNMGGEVYSPVGIYNNHTDSLRIQATGSNNWPYFRQRNARTEAWSEWAPVL